MTIRLFVGIEVPQDHRAQLQALQTGLDGVRWVKPESLHLTLRFIGEVPETEFNPIASNLSKIKAKAFDLTLKGVDQFGGNRPRAVWAGTEPCEGLTHLANKVEQALQKAGQPAETRNFSAHVTLARFKQRSKSRLLDYLSDHGLFKTEPFHVSQFVLFSSMLGKGGGHYIPEVKFGLEE